MVTKLPGRSWDTPIVVIEHVKTMHQTNNRNITSLNFKSYDHVLASHVFTQRKGLLIINYIATQLLYGLDNEIILKQTANMALRKCFHVQYDG